MCVRVGRQGRHQSSEFGVSQRPRHRSVARSRIGSASRFCSTATAAFGASAAVRKGWAAPALQCDVAGCCTM
eukprot:m.273463 g.273463  ORF g.273463 m.273463 type:complete len:72 (+) comp11090_c1_seq15:2713-2928(+)